MAKHIQYSVSLTPEEALERLRSNAADPATVLESIQRLRGIFTFFGVHKTPVVAEIDGHKFQLRLHGFRISLQEPTSQHLDGSVEATPGGSRIDAKLIGFLSMDIYAFLASLAYVVLGIFLGVFLIEMPLLAIMISVPFIGLGVGNWVLYVRHIAAQKKRLVDFLDQTFNNL